LPSFNELHCDIFAYITYMNRSIEDMPLPTFTSIFNFRPVRDGRLYRSAALDDTSDADMKKFLDYTDITYRVDLRSPIEIWREDRDGDGSSRNKKISTRFRRATVAKRKRVQTLPGATTAQLTITDLFGTSRRAKKETDALVSRRSRLDAGRKVEITHVNFLNAEYRDKVIFDRCTFFDKLKLLGYFVTFRFDAMIKFVGQKLLARGGLQGSYRDFVDHSDRAIDAALKEVVEHLELGHSIGINCSLGKDRTGIVVAFVRHVLGDSLDEICHDYELSETAMGSLMERAIRNFRNQGLPDDFAKSPAAVMRSMFDYVDERYGSVENYLDKIGFDESWRNRLSDALIDAN